MKKKLMLRLSVLVLISAAVLSCGRLKPDNKLNDTRILIGTGRGYSSQIKVGVTMRGGAIVSIDLLESGDTPGLVDAAFEGIVHSVLKSQTTENVDAVTGATGSSKGVLEAITNALAEVK